MRWRHILLINLQVVAVNWCQWFKTWRRDIVHLNFVAFKLSLYTKGRAIKIIYHRADENEDRNFLLRFSPILKPHQTSTGFLAWCWNLCGVKMRKSFPCKSINLHSAVESRTELLFARWKHNFSFKRYFGFYIKWSGAIASFAWTFLRCCCIDPNWCFTSFWCGDWSFMKVLNIYASKVDWNSAIVQGVLDQSAEVWHASLTFNLKSLLGLELNFSVDWTPAAPHTNLGN